MHIVHISPLTDSDHRDYITSRKMVKGLFCSGPAVIGLIIIELFSFSLAAIDKALLESCCLQGTKYATDSDTCEGYSQSVPGVATRDQPSCLTILRVCCMKQKQRDQCQNGKTDALSYSRCAIRDDMFGSEQYKECCHCCQLGLISQSMRGDCSLLQKENFGGPCDATFSECCLGSASLNSTTAVNDIDECALHRGHICGQICVNTIGSYRCDCNPGYTLHSDGSTCIQDRPTGCKRYNPCQQKCVDDDNGFSCACNQGYELLADGVSCGDLDECASGTADCPQGHGCYNREGSYRCRPCPQGTEVDPISKGCRSLPQCRKGYSYNTVSGSCEDIDECATEMNTCTARQRCENTIGSYVCRRILGCGTGYSMMEDTQTCKDIDECLLGTHNCPSGFECVNMDGSFRCRQPTCQRGYRFSTTKGQCVSIQCPRGREADSKGMCVDIDECRQSGICPLSARCVNTYGSYRCIPSTSCPQGHQIDPVTQTCVDIDECARRSHNCTNDQQCVNIAGGFSCTCGAGFRRNSQGSCEDLDECSYGNICPFNGVCENTPGSYKCNCNPGTVLRGRSCIDIDECETRNICEHRCVNIVGSYECTCRPGYKLNPDKRTCSDIDECQSYTGRVCGGACVNTPGSYMCTCPEGWRTLGGGRSCQDIDECAEGTYRCTSQESMCFNTRGSYKCPQVTCPKGFVRTPVGPRRNSVPCKRTSFTCQRGDVECLTAPISLSYNFLSFPSNIKIPTDLFAMSGPRTSQKQFTWDLKVIQARPLKSGVMTVNRGYFDLKIKNSAQAVVSLNYRIPGPQDVELELTMQITDLRSRYTGTAVSKIFLYVTGESVV